MSIVSWSEKVAATEGLKPIARYNVGGIYYEDYKLNDGYWRYSWVNFTLSDNPEFVEVNLMEV